MIALFLFLSLGSNENSKMVRKNKFVSDKS